MATTSKIFQIQQGTSQAAAGSFTLLSAGVSGDPDAKRQLVHPDSVNFPAITYRRNPDDTVNLVRGQVPGLPVGRFDRTLSSSVVTRFDRTVDGMKVIERWVGDARRAAMIGNQLVEILNYWLNPPTFVPGNEQFIRWKPRDEGNFEYDVEFIEVRAGGANVEELIDAREFREPGGIFNGGQIATVLDNIDGATPTGLILAPVEVEMKIVEEFAV